MKLTEEEKADGKSKRIMFVVDAKQQVNIFLFGDTISIFQG